jgi:hypothetical protein
MNIYFCLVNQIIFVISLGLTASNRNKEKKIFLGVKHGRRVRLTNLAAIYKPIVLKMWDPRRLRTL